MSRNARVNASCDFITGVECNLGDRSTGVSQTPARPVSIRRRRLNSSGVSPTHAAEDPWKWKGESPAAAARVTQVRRFVEIRQDVFR
jgi:hypothetical protein